MQIAASAGLTTPAPTRPIPTPVSPPPDTAPPPGPAPASARPHPVPAGIPEPDHPQLCGHRTKPEIDPLPRDRGLQPPQHMPVHPSRAIPHTTACRLLPRFPLPRPAPQQTAATGCNSHTQLLPVTARPAPPLCQARFRTFGPQSSRWRTRPATGRRGHPCFHRPGTWCRGYQDCTGDRRGRSIPATSVSMHPGRSADSGNPLIPCREELCQTYLCLLGPRATRRALVKSCFAVGQCYCNTVQRNMLIAVSTLHTPCVCHHHQ